MKINTILIISACMFYACSSDKSTETGSVSTPAGESDVAEEVTESTDYMIGDGRDDATASRLAEYLTTDLVAGELEYLLPEQRNFRYAQADLNDDGTVEYLIEFRNSYFCGSGGCTYLLIEEGGSLITSFSVSQAPFAVLASKSSGWHDLVIPQGDGFHIIKYSGSSYPSNPSVEPSVDMSSVEVIGEMFADESLPAYEF